MATNDLRTSEWIEAQRIMTGETVQDGRATATVVSVGRGEVQMEYDDTGKRIWIQDNVFQRHSDTRALRTV